MARTTIDGTVLSSQSGRATASSTTTVANGATVSGVIDTSAKVLAGVQTPAALTSTTMTFQASYDGVTYVALYDEYNNLFQLTVAVSRAYALPVNLFAPWAFVKVVAGSAEGGDRIIGLSLIAV